MLKGKALDRNSTIGIITPASPESNNIIDEKIKIFSSLGFKVKLGKHIYDKYGYLSGYDYNRAKDINDMFLDPSIDGIVCFRGGYGCGRILPFIDKDTIINNPKFFCGYSDVTLLLNYFCKLGLITFHGPMINSDFTNEETLRYFLNISSCNSSNFSYDLSTFDNIHIINKKIFSGKIVGGNLSVICSSLGTPYDIDTKDSILILEDINEVPYSIDRMLTQLLLSGKFENCNAIILGSFKDCSLNDYSRSLTLYEILLDRLSNLDIPIILNFPFGHDYPNITIPIGSSATYYPDFNKFTLTTNFLT